MLPGADGYHVLKRVRQNGGGRVPVIVLSPKTQEQDRIRGFRLDADQYVTKPFSILELSERIAALPRRSALERSPHSRMLELAT
ncbi:MAG TPA: response regulator [Gemmatimonadaceae bacterium]|jgi:two-component system response regulator PfeR|nr:response regulator [Gemmatimonadaceae bacterium]